MDLRLSQEAVENLVTQFSSALDFYRELVQNAIDAGSSSIEVWTEFIPSEDGGGDGTWALHVDDFGEGMNEAVIDDQLTKLFASAKENDLTKIGKFGIGFVSVFAMKPKAVLVHTGRAGEFWELLFHEDRSFTKTRVDHPVEGTQITVFVGGDYAGYRETVQGSRETLSRWCAHSETEVTFEDRSPQAGDDRGMEPVNAPFVASGACGTPASYAGGTEIVLAYTHRPVYGFYNKGLALAVSESGEDVMGQHAGRFGCIGFKIKSRWLEHTLSRETVIRDENFEKAMAMVHEAADGPLRTSLVRELERVAAADDWTLATATTYRRLLRFLAMEPPSIWRDDPILEARMMRTVDGEATSLREIAAACRRDDRVYVASVPSPLTKLLAELAIPVLLSDRMASDTPSKQDPTTHVLVDFLIAQRGVLSGAVDRVFDVDAHAGAMERVVHPQHVFVPTKKLSAPPPHIEELILRVARLLDRANVGYSEIAAGTVEALEEAAPLFVLGAKLGRLMARPPGAQYERGRFERPSALINVHHPHFRAIEAMYKKDWSMAVYCLARSLMLEEDHGIDKDIVLMEHATSSFRRGSSSAWPKTGETRSS